MKKLYIIIAILVIFTSLQGCQDKTTAEKLTEYQNQIQALNKQLKSLQVENKEITTRHGQLIEENQKLTKEKENINKKAKNQQPLTNRERNELQDRIRELEAKITDITYSYNEKLGKFEEKYIEEHSELKKTYNQLFNFFDPNEIKIGDKVGGMTVTNISEENGIKSVEFSGELKVRGSIFVPESEVLNADSMFNLSFYQSYNIPQNVPHYINGLAFYKDFDNEDRVTEVFDKYMIKNLEVDATFYISKIKYIYGEHNSNKMEVRFDKVDSIYPQYVYGFHY